jgi:hypothetical protein
MAATLIISPFSADAESLPGGTHYINDNVRLEPLPDDFKMRITEYLDGIDEVPLGKQIRAKPAFAIAINEVPLLKSIKSNNERCAVALQIHRFCLEYFADAPIPMAAFHHDGTNVIAHEIDRDGLLFRPGQEVHFDRKSWDKQLAYANFAYSNIERAPAAETVINRICRAFREGANTDGIIDIAIALEALVESKIEIKFQFSLYNALVESHDVARREATFSLLKTLYDVRSLAVHGGKPSKKEKAKIDEVAANWQKLVDLARANLTYYLNFCRENDHATWADHIRSLAFGTPRFAPEEN